MSLPRNGRWWRRGGGGDGGEFFFGGGQQLLAFAGALLGQRGVVAAHQPLAGKLRGGDLEEVLLVKQRQLQRALLDEGLDLRGAQRADPIQLGWAHLVADARVGEHAPIPDQADPAQPEPVLELGDLGGQGFRVGGVALEHLDGHRYPGGRAQQPVDDLQPAFHPVAGVPDRPQRAGAALKRRRGHVIEHQRAVGQMPRGKGVFDAVFARQRPVHRRIQVVLITAGHPEQLAQRAGGGLGAQPPGDRQLRAGPITWATSIAVTSRAAATGPGRSVRRSESACGAQHRRDMPVRQAAGDLKRLGKIRAAGRPFSARVSVSTLCSGQRDRLARVRVFTLPSSR